MPTNHALQLAVSISEVATGIRHPIIVHLDEQDRLTVSPRHSATAIRLLRDDPELVAGIYNERVDAALVVEDVEHMLTAIGVDGKLLYNLKTIRVNNQAAT